MYLSQEILYNLTKDYPCVPLAIKTIMIVLFKSLTLFHFKAIGSSWMTLNEVLIVSIAKGTQCILPFSHISVKFTFISNSQENSKKITKSFTVSAINQTLMHSYLSRGLNVKNFQMHLWYYHKISTAPFKAYKSFTLHSKYLKSNVYVQET